jgi:hypothetical protein
MTRSAPGAGIRHPVALAAIAVLALNDHYLKAAYPGFITGKLSDVAGLIFFPLLLCGMCELVEARGRREWSPSWRMLVACVGATGLGFALAKLWLPANALYSVMLGALQWPVRAVVSLAHHRALPHVHPVRLVRDATDLLALPALAVPLWVGAARCAFASARAVRFMRRALALQVRRRLVNVPSVRSEWRHTNEIPRT